MRPFILKRIRPVSAITAAAIVVFFSACGHSRRASALLPTTEPFELSVHTVRTEDVGDPGTDSPTRASYESDITYFGRFEDPHGPESMDRIVYNDSIRFATRQPYRLEAFMSIDTLYSRSGSSNTAMSSETLGPSDSMLVCIFYGPALRIAPPTGNGNTVTIVNLKTNCPGGIYRRLDPPKTLGMFLTEVSSEHRSVHSRWERIKDGPSFSGLGYCPRLRLEYWVSGIEGGNLTVEIHCDTTITKVTTVMPNGEKVDIIGNRVVVRGTLHVTGSNLWHEGQIRMSEEVKYVRPALDTRVLSKSCVYELSLRRSNL